MHQEKIASWKAHLVHSLEMISDFTKGQHTITLELTRKLKV